jgi:hypothetical protein
MHLIEDVSSFVGWELLEKNCSALFVECLEDVGCVMRVIASQLLPGLLMGIEVILCLIGFAPREFADR